MTRDLETKFHLLQHSGPLPLIFNNPFHYQPDELCEKAFEILRKHIEQSTSDDFLAELQSGKMLGVLVAQNAENQLGFLAAYSGQLNGKFDTEYYVPAVFDYLDHDGYFKTNERLISAINAEIIALQNDHNYQCDKDLLIKQQKENEAVLLEFRHKMMEAKQRRAERRKSADLTAEEEAFLVNESQFQKAEYKRMCRAAECQLSEIQARITAHESRISALKQRRKQDSENLQNWLFSHFVFRNYNGESKSLLEIFHSFNGKIPPSGSGECCAPKLLQFAYCQNLRPISMAEFWWGNSPAQEIRHHLHHYPACNGKCKPILDFMLQGLKFKPDILSVNNENVDSQEFKTVYIDDSIIAIDKPSGMLSVPGKSDRISAEDIVRQQFGEAYSCHRLDMDTSGLMIFARSKTVLNEMRRQFENREIHKHYVAIVGGIVTEKNGKIDLPIMPDLYDSPRQIVDLQNGKKTVTYYEVIKTGASETLLRLHPYTGRTHQLRVHCAHIKGLNAPIKGDRLYGSSPAPRLFLHAESITFSHPASGEKMELTAKCPDWDGSLN